MKLYLNNLIQRLKEFSVSLDKIETFVDVPWVIVDENLNQQKYIFKRNGDLIMSLNGQVSIGKWELLSAARSILIDRIQDKILLNQNFIDSAVMVLKKDGLKDENLILANEILIPDLNVTGYLNQLYYEKNKIVLKRLKNGVNLEIVNYGYGCNDIYNSKVTIEGEPVPDGRYALEESEMMYFVKDSRIIRNLACKPYDTNKGRIVIEESSNPYLIQYSSLEGGRPHISDFVYQNNNLAPDGKYRLSFMNSILIQNGRIIKKTTF